GDAIDDDFGDSAAVGGDDGFAGGHAFDDDLAERFAGGGGVDDDVELIDELGDVVAEAGKFDGVVELELGAEGADFLLVSLFGEESGADDLEARGGVALEN